jgi:hypothetical protein
MFLVKRVVVLENLLLLFKRDSTSQKTLLNFTLKRLKFVVSVLLLKLNPSNSNFSKVLLSEEPAMVFFVSLWTLVPRVVKLLSPVSFVLPVPSL